MNEPWTSLVAVSLVALGVAAELNLLRALIREWKESRPEVRTRRFRAAQPAPRAQATAESLTGIPWLPAACCSAALCAAPSFGLATQSERLETAAASLTLNAAPAPLSFAQALQQAPTQAPSQPARETPLTIATNRPSFDDATNIVPIGHVQLETGYTFTFRHRDGVETQTHDGPEALFRVPLVDDRLELQVGWTGYAYSRSDSGSGVDTADGLSDATAGLRLKVADESGWVPRICLQASTTVGLGSDGVSNQDVEPVFKFIWSYDLGRGWGLCGNVGVGYLTAGSDRFIQGQGGFCLSYTINDKWSVFGEYYLFGPNSKGTDAAHYIDAGAAYLLTPRIQLDGRVGAGLNNEANNLFAGAGISFLF